MKAPKNNKKKAQPAGLAMPGVDVAQLESLLDFMAAHGLEEFEYEHEGLHIRLKKAVPGLEAVAQPAPSARKAVASPVVGAPAAAAVAPAATAAPDVAAAPVSEELHIIKSP